MLEEYINKITCGDCLEVMKKLPDNSIDLVVTSPPYNLRNSTGSGMQKPHNTGKWKHAKLGDGYDTYQDNIPNDEYVSWQRNCLSEMFRLIKDNGAIFYNHKWRVQDGMMQDRSDIVKDFPVRQIIIWQRSGGINFNDNYFLPTYEVIYLIAKKDFKLVKGACRHTDVWKFDQERNSDHPAPFPRLLTDRIISSTEARIVLDPFSGSGTTAVSAKNLHRDFIAIEISEKYCEMAKERLGINSEKNIDFFLDN